MRKYGFSLTRILAYFMQYHVNHKLCYPHDSLLNGISEKLLSRNHQVIVRNFPGGNSKKILEERNNLVADKPDCIIVHAGMNNITNSINSLNSVKKIAKHVKKRFANTKLVFSSRILRKIKKTFRKK